MAVDCPHNANIRSFLSHVLDVDLKTLLENSISKKTQEKKFDAM